MSPTIDGQRGAITTINKRIIRVPFYIQHQTTTEVRQNIGKSEVMLIFICTIRKGAGMTQCERYSPVLCSRNTSKADTAIEPIKPFLCFANFRTLGFNIRCT